MNDFIELDLGEPKNKKHPKCLGYKTWTDCGYEYDCGYGSELSCEECKYGPYPDKHSKDPNAKCNQS